MLNLEPNLKGSVVNGKIQRPDPWEAGKVPGWIIKPIEGMMPPQGWGVAWTHYGYQVAMPIPFNILAGWIRGTWLWMVCPGFIGRAWDYERAYTQALRTRVSELDHEVAHLRFLVKCQGYVVTDAPAAPFEADTTVERVHRFGGAVFDISSPEQEEALSVAIQGLHGRKVTVEDP